MMREFADIAIEGPTKEFAVVSTITDNFIGLGATFLLSLVEAHKQDPSFDIILIQDPVVAPLSEANRSHLRNIYSAIKIIDVDSSSFLNEETLTRYGKDGKPVRLNLDKDKVPSKKAVYLKLSVLRISQYKKVILLDSDLLILDDISELFKLPADVACIRAGNKHDNFSVGYFGKGEKNPPFNSGVLVLGQKCRGGRWFDRAIRLLLRKRNTVLQDQSIFNMLFKKSETLFLPKTYNFRLNARKKGFLAARKPLVDAKIIHFVGPSKFALKDAAHGGQHIYERFHSVQKRTGIPFTLEP